MEKRCLHQPVRVLQVVEAMDQAGTETWLMHVLRNIDRSSFNIDFVVSSTSNHYADEIRSLGSQIFTCKYPNQPWRYAKQFGRVLQTHGPYDIVHCHLHHYSGLVMRSAHRAGVPMRIAHSHSDTSVEQWHASLLRRAYLRLMERWIQVYATHGIAVSQLAASALFGKGWMLDQRWQIIHCGIDLSPFYPSKVPSALRDQLGIPANAFVLGHVGRFVPVKNHQLLIRMMQVLSEKDPGAYLLLVGDGPLRVEIEDEAQRYGVRSKIIFTGLRNDIAALLTDCIDVFVMPSLYEGLPLAGLEAQAAGLPCIFSKTITDELTIYPPLVKRLSIQEEPTAWAEVALSFRNIDKETRVEAYTAISQSEFNIERNIERLIQLYHMGLQS